MVARAYGLRWGMSIKAYDEGVFLELLMENSVPLLKWLLESLNCTSCTLYCMTKVGKKSTLYVIST